MREEKGRCKFLGNAGGDTFGGKKLTFPVDLKMHIIHEPPVVLLGTESQDILAYVQQNTWSRMFLATPGLIEKMVGTLQNASHTSASMILTT